LSRGSDWPVLIYDKTQKDEQAAHQQGICRWAAIRVFAVRSPARQSCRVSKLTDQATVLGLPNARFWADTDGPAMLREAMEGVEPRGESAERCKLSRIVGWVRQRCIRGRRSSGMVRDWHRPPFKLVTGISTGALVAPFAFLGSAYDPQLRAVPCEEHKRS